MSPARSGILLTPFLLLAACGGSEGGDGLEFPAAADSINLEAGAGHGGSELLWGVGQMDLQSPRLVEIPASSASAAATGELLASIDRLVAAAGGVQRAPLASLSMVDCNPVITGFDGDELIDTDADGIPDDYKVDYGTSCVSEPDNAIVRVTISGYRRLQDDGHGFRSFRVTVKELRILVEYLSTGAVHWTVLNGVEEGRFAAGGAHYSTDVTIAEFTSDPHEPDQEWYRRVDLDLTFTPAVGQALTFAAPLPAGSVTLGGRMQHIEPEVIDRIWYDFELDTPTPLQWSPSCNGGDFTVGVFRGHYNGDPQMGFRLTWDNCDSLEKELFGY